MSLDLGLLLSLSSPRKKKKKVQSPLFDALKSHVMNEHAAIQLHVIRASALVGNDSCDIDAVRQSWVELGRMRPVPCATAPNPTVEL